MVRRLVSDGEFIEVFVDTPIDECARRDPKGLYTKAKAGKIKNFTGIDAPYEPPVTPEIHLQTIGHQPEQLADLILKKMAARGNRIGEELIRRPGAKFRSRHHSGLVRHAPLPLVQRQVSPMAVVRFLLTSRCIRRAHGTL